MSQYILKAIANRANQSPAEVTLGHIWGKGETQRQTVKAQPGAIYRLVDSKTGQVVKGQSLLRKGKTLQVIVDNLMVVEIEGFFSSTVDAKSPATESAKYVISQGTDSEPTYGFIYANTQYFRYSLISQAT